MPPPENRFQPFGAKDGFMALSYVVIRNLLILLSCGIAISPCLKGQDGCSTQKAEVDKLNQWVSYDRGNRKSTLTTNEAKLAAASESLKQCQKSGFLSACKAVAPILGADIGPILCDATVRENADQPENLALYEPIYEHLAGDLKKLGPEAAKQLVLQCTQNATQTDPKPAATLFCLRLKTLDIQKLAEGKGTIPEYAGLIGDNGRQQAGGLPAVYPTGDSPNERQQRAAVRSAMVSECLKDGDQYLKMVCGGLTIHEMLAREPYGDSGEIAKAADKLQNVLGITSAVSNAPKIMAQQVLTQIGVPSELVRAPDQVQQTVNEQLQKGTQAVVGGINHVNDEIQKAAPPATKGNVQIGNIKLCSPFGC